MNSFWLILFLGLSILAVVAGGAIALISRDRPVYLRLLRGFSAGAIGALIFLHLLPETVEELGGYGLLLALGGLLSVWFLEKLGGHDEEAESAGSGLGAAELVLFGLSVHAMIDGLGLVAAAREGVLGSPMAWAIIAHRLPVAAVLCWAFLRRVSARAAFARLSLLVFATIAGAVAGESLIMAIGPELLDGLRAFVAGTLLHILLHDFLAYPAETKVERQREVASFLVGLAVVVPASFLGDHHGHHGEGSSLGRLSTAFFDLFIEAAPFILIGALFAGILTTRISSTPIRFLSGRSDVSSAIRGTLFGLPLPICSCGILPAIDPLVRSGAPVAAVTAFLLATPELGVDALFISWKMLGGPVTIIRVIVAVVLVLTVSLLVAKFGRAKQETPSPFPVLNDCCDSPKTTGTRLRDRAVNAMRSGFVDTMDDIGPWLVFGIAIGALVQVMVPPGGLAALAPAPWDVFALALLGIPLYVCATGATPLAAVLLIQGASPGAVLAFLMVGPATNIATLGYFSRVWGKRSAAVLGISSFGVAAALGLLVNALFDPSWIPDSASIFAESHGPFELGLAVVLGFIMLAGIWRTGPLRWMTVVFSTFGIGGENSKSNHNSDDTDCDQCCGSD